MGRVVVRWGECQKEQQQFPVDPEAAPLVLLVLLGGWKAVLAGSTFTKRQGTVAGILGNLLLRQLIKRVERVRTDSTLDVDEGAESLGEPRERDTDVFVA